MGVHFKPGGAFPFLAPPSDELADRHINLEAIWGRAASQIRERLSAAGSPVRRFRLLESLLLSTLAHSLEHHSAVSLALDTFAHTRGRARTRQLARQAGLSEKRFIDVFKAEVGLTPKLFHRIVRFQEVLARVHQDSAPDWTQLALSSGYFDQSHLIRDFFAFSGFTPGDYLRRLHDLRMQGSPIKFNHLPLSV